MSNEDEQKFAKVTVRVPHEDGSTEIITNSFYEKLAYTTKEVEKQLVSSKKDILKDLVTCVEPLIKGAVELNVYVKVKSDGTLLITRKHTVEKKSFGKR